MSEKDNKKYRSTAWYGSKDMGGFIHRSWM